MWIEFGDEGGTLINMNQAIKIEILYNSKSSLHNQSAKIIIHLSDGQSIKERYSSEDFIGNDRKHEAFMCEVNRRYAEIVDLLKAVRA